MRSLLAAVAATTLTITLGASPAHAEGAQTLSGPATGDAEVYLTYVGCESLFGAAAAPQSRINLGPYAAPMGRRSLGLVPAGPGSASGPYARFGSLAGLDASLSVAATGGSRGVSWVMAVTGSSPVGTAWRGRAAVSVPAGSWSAVSAADLAYDWTLVDLGSGSPVKDVGTGTPAQFAAEQGDGVGFVVTGFGCDGKAFNLDAVRASGSTFDFEGVQLTTSLSAGRQQVAPGGEVELTGRVTDASGRVTGDPLVLESRTPGGAWSAAGRPVLADRDGIARVVVPVSETTEFRWHRVEGQYADEGRSQSVTVTVTQPEKQPEKQPEQQPEGAGDGHGDKQDDNQDDKQSEAPAQQ
ncbi:hypothetical protein GCM10023339_38760 [Alloalcanivorax gelatiniphagus]